MNCHSCKKQSDKLYELRGWKVCWNCYWKDVDKVDKKEKIRKG